MALNASCMRQSSGKLTPVIEAFLKSVRGGGSLKQQRIEICIVSDFIAERVAHVAAPGFLYRYLSGPLPYV